MCDPESRIGSFSDAFAPAEDVSGRIDPHLEPGFLHQPDDVFARGQVGLGEADPGDTALGIAAELAELLEGALEAPRVDVERRKSRPPLAGESSEGGKKEEGEKPSFEGRISDAHRRTAGSSGPAVKSRMSRNGVSRSVKSGR